MLRVESRPATSHGVAVLDVVPQDGRLVAQLDRQCHRPRITCPAANRRIRQQTQDRTRSVPTGECVFDKVGPIRPTKANGSKVSVNLFSQTLNEGKYRSSGPVRHTVPPIQDLDDAMICKMANVTQYQPSAEASRKPCQGRDNARRLRGLSKP